MKMLLFIAPILTLLTGPLVAASIQVAKPEEVGFSSDGWRELRKRSSDTSTLMISLER